MIKLYMFIIALIAICYSGNALAMRCGNSLIEVGDAQYIVEQACGPPLASHTTNTGGQGDQVFLYYKINNLTEELQFIDGHLYEIHDIYGS